MAPSISVDVIGDGLGDIQSEALEVVGSVVGGLVAPVSGGPPDNEADGLGRRRRGCVPRFPETLQEPGHSG
jgi:hypothetical protein